MSVSVWRFPPGTGNRSGPREGQSRGEMSQTGMLKAGTKTMNSDELCRAECGC